MTAFLKLFSLAVMTSDRFLLEGVRLKSEQHFFLFFLSTEEEEEAHKYTMITQKHCYTQLQHTQKHIYSAGKHQKIGTQITTQ